VSKGENEDFGGVEVLAELSVVEVFFKFGLDTIFSGCLEELVYCVFRGVVEEGVDTVFCE